MSSILDDDHSKWWYLAPIVGALVGGLIAFFALRGDAPHMAKYCLLIGIISEIIMIMIYDMYYSAVGCYQLVLFPF